MPLSSQIESVHPTSHAISVFLSPGTQRALPSALLHRGSDWSSAAVESKLLSIADIYNPTALERGVLDVDARVSASDKFAQDADACPGAAVPSPALKNAIVVRAWKAFTVWRWPDDVFAGAEAEMQHAEERGGRERVATLFYLRGVA